MNNIALHMLYKDVIGVAVFVTIREKVMRVVANQTLNTQHTQECIKLYIVVFAQNQIHNI